MTRRLGRVLNRNPRALRRKIRRDARQLPFSPVTLKTDVGLTTVLYLQENQSRFPGVEVERVFLRKYPHEAIGAHLFGQLGEVTEDQLDRPRYSGVALGDRVGQSGIELQYDRYLRGRNGASRIQVDARGLPKGELSVRDPRPGKRLRLSIDFGVQKAGQAALARYGKPGGFVAMDPRSGEVIGLGSNPSYDPNVFAKGISSAVYKRLQDPDNGAPLANRATQGLYPTGSTFKLITAVAGLESGLISPATVLFDGGSLTVGGVTFKNAGNVSHGAVALPRALQVSSDVFFYRVGLMADQKGGEVIQKWAEPPRARPHDRDRPSRRGRRPGADAGVAQPPVPPQPHRPALELGRQRQPGGGPGRPAGQPAPDGGRLQRRRQRRPRRDAAHRPARGEQRRAASCSRSSRARGGA